ncbi:unnamed protein product [Didymodactylos carnosus]|uniref:Uncharacterized protein n=1 Tax=Didymodactylos carnosus TaxID=1234261 RepID=A0A815JKG0_9BILA|nr:unnamed protein product [Didymodactylos carnosus]CAF1383469.1 unnamed protein product [Didymodactylos carnosus]CAF3738369.1 unnamed protein product [Didymodactylos carnosus]CAF4278536.1 unnamed protein product [Didymodactylos carnosus]
MSALRPIVRYDLLMFSSYLSIKSLYKKKKLGFEVAFTLTLQFVVSGSLKLNPYLSYDIAVKQNSVNKTRIDATGVLSGHLDTTVQATLGIIIEGISIDPKHTSPTYTLYQFAKNLLSSVICKYISQAKIFYGEELAPA